MTKKSITDDIVARVQARYPEVHKSVTAYLAPSGGRTTTDRTQELIAGDPTASELLARGYPQYVAEGVARSRQEEQQ